MKRALLVVLLFLPACRTISSQACDQITVEASAGLADLAAIESGNLTQEQVQLVVAKQVRAWCDLDFSVNGREHPEFGLVKK